MKDTLDALKSGPCSLTGPSFTKVLQGPGGAGKTITLVVTGYLAKKSGCIVLPVQGKYFTNGTMWLNSKVHNFLIQWLKGSR